MEYLKRASDIREKVVKREHDDVPESLQGNEDAMAFYGVIRPYFDGEAKQVDQLDRIASGAALAINTIIHRHRKVHFWDDADAQKRAMNDIDDYLYDEIRGAHDRTGCRQFGAIWQRLVLPHVRLDEQSGQAKVEDFDDSFFRDHQVVRLDVAMDHAFFVRIL